jgi:hypothetical protein
VELTESERTAGAGVDGSSCHGLITGVDGVEKVGGVKTPGVRPSLFFFKGFLKSGFVATW